MTLKKTKDKIGPLPFLQSLQLHTSSQSLLLQQAERKSMQVWFWCLSDNDSLGAGK